MKRLLWPALFAGALSLISSVFAVGVSNPALRVQEEDGSPAGVATKIKFSNGTVTRSGTTFTVQTGGGEGGGGGSGDSIYPATGTPTFPFGMNASSVAVTGNDISILLDDFGGSGDPYITLNDNNGSPGAGILFQESGSDRAKWYRDTSGTWYIAASTFSTGSPQTRISFPNTTAGITVPGTLRLSSLNCTGNSNSGALTTDSSGNVTCSDDDGGAGGGGSGYAIEPATVTIQADHGLTASTLTVSGQATFNSSSTFVGPAVFTLTPGTTQQADLALIEPDLIALVTSTITMFPVDSHNYPSGVRITAIKLMTVSASTCTYKVYEWTSPTDGSPVLIDTISTTNQTEVTETTITDADVDAGSYVRVLLDDNTSTTCDVAEAHVTVWFYPRY